MQSLWARGNRKGPLFANDQGKPMSISELDVYFHGLLREVQQRYPKVIEESVDVEKEYSMYHSLQRGTTLEAQNADIGINVIESHNQWRKKMRSNGIKPNTSMMEHYTDAKVAAPSLIKFSRSLPS